MIQFAYPYMFLLLILPFIVNYLLPPIKGLHGDALRIPFINDLEKISIKSGGIWKMSGNVRGGYSRLFWIMFAVWILLTVAAARPQKVGEPIRLKNEGRDILLVTDISNSMQQADFSLQNRRLDRLSAVKLVASDFIKKRTEDRIGLILFGTRSYLQAPLTFDKKSVIEILWQTEAGIAGNSTAIGDALGLALKTLKGNGDAKNKIIILLTDGENNDGSLSLAQAIKLAQEENFKIYTIGVGNPKSYAASFFGMQLGNPNGLDEEELKKLAEVTKGTYFRAEDTSGLLEIYNTINRLEPNLHDERYIRETTELFYVPLLFAIVIVCILAILLKGGH